MDYSFWRYLKFPPPPCVPFTTLPVLLHKSNVPFRLNRHTVVGFLKRANFSSTWLGAHIWVGAI